MDIISKTKLDEQHQLVTSKKQSKGHITDEGTSNLISDEYDFELDYDEETIKEFEALAEQQRRREAGLPVYPTQRQLEAMYSFKDQDENIRKALERIERSQSPALNSKRNVPSV